MSETGQDPPSAKGTTIKALSTKTVLVRCWETPTDSGSRNFTKQTREVTGKGESLEKNTDMLCKKYKRGATICLLHSELDWSWTPGTTGMWTGQWSTLEKWQQNRQAQERDLGLSLDGFGKLRLTTSSSGSLTQWMDLDDYKLINRWGKLACLLCTWQWTLWLIDWLFEKLERTHQRSHDNATSCAPPAHQL